ncbi:MAG: ATP-dependent helicase, partial [Lachnospiraceae bacterium]
MTDEQFLEQYGKDLNSQQKEALVTVNGMILLLAVPGSGKTTVLVTRLGYMTKCKNINPENILTLTYTVEATKDMRKRYNQIFGNIQEKNQIEFRTINGICSKIILEYGRAIKKNPFTLVTDEKQLVRILSEIYKKVLNEFPTESDIKTIRTWITYIKNRMLLKEEIIKIEKVEGIPIYKIYKEYEKHLKEASLMDFDDQLVYAYKILKHSSVLLERFQNRYHYICVDEAQDTSKIQHAIIALLASSKQNLFMVGDEDQSIYGFRAAYPEALLEFKKNYNNAFILLMEKNYRSDSNIVNMANAFIQNNKYRHKKHMISTRQAKEGISFLDVKTRKVQSEYLLEVAKKCSSNTAILYRDHESVLPLIDLLERNNITYRCKNADPSFFSNRVIIDILRILKFTFEPQNTELFMHIYYKLQFFLKKQQALKLCEESKNTGKEILKIIEKDVIYPPLLKRNAKSMATHFISLKKESPSKAIHRIMNFMGYGEYLERNNIKENKIEILKMLAQNEITIEGFLHRIELLQNIVQNKKQDFSSSLILSTIHSSKGLEYEKVYLMDVFDGQFPDHNITSYKNATGDEKNKYEEERRLFYVALTRAKNKLYIFHIKNC